MDSASGNRSFIFDTPEDIAMNTTEKDLKCTGKRYVQAVGLNRKIGEGPFLQAVERYSGIMHDAIDYKNMSDAGKKYFEDHFLILS